MRLGPIICCWVSLYPSFLTAQLTISSYAGRCACTIYHSNTNTTSDPQMSNANQSNWYQVVGDRFCYGHLYRIQQTWQNANNSCASANLNLPILKSREAYEYFIKLSKGLSLYLHVGLYKQGDDWFWVDGTTANYTVYGNGKCNETRYCAINHTTNQWENVYDQLEVDWVCQMNCPNSKPTTRPTSKETEPEPFSLESTATNSPKTANITTIVVAVGGCMVALQVCLIFCYKLRSKRKRKYEITTTQIALNPSAEPIPQELLGKPIGTTIEAVRQTQEPVAHVKLDSIKRKGSSKSGRIGKKSSSKSGRKYNKVKAKVSDSRCGCGSSKSKLKKKKKDAMMQLNFMEPEGSLVSSSMETPASTPDGSRSPSYAQKQAMAGKKEDNDGNTQVIYSANEDIHGNQQVRPCNKEGSGGNKEGTDSNKESNGGQKQAVDGNIEYNHGNQQTNTNDKVSDLPSALRLILGQEQTDSLLLLKNL